MIASGSISALDLSTLPPADTGVYATSASYGVYGFSPGGVGVTGFSTSGYGIYGYTNSNNGVYGYSVSGKGVAGYSTSGFGVSGVSSTSYGIYGESSSYRAVYGKSSSADGVYGESTSGYGISGYSSSNTAVNGYSATGYGVSGWSNSSYGVYGFSPNSYAGYFVGNVHVGGTLDKASGSFKIDHPLDPENKYLYHSFVESPDMMNIYNGNVTLDNQGEAIVELPGWFEALNSDFRYQLTPIGTAMPDLFIAEKITNRRFKIAGGKAGQEVSWQVTGIRQDEWAKAHRIPVEVDKTGDEKGKYLHPELFGQGEEKSVSPRPPQRPGK